MAERFLQLLLVMLLLAACGRVQPQAGGVEGDIREAWVVLPGTTEAQQVTFRVVDGLAIFEGDIILGTVDEVSGTGLRPHGFGAEGHNFRWPNGVIPFVIGPGISDDGEKNILAAIAEWEAKTPINFIPRSNQGNYVKFVKGSADDACFSAVGMTGGEQHVTMKSDGNCALGTLIHELGHAVGLYHEHTRPDRDDFVEIQWDNIESYRYAFNRRSGGIRHGPYDFDSIMHYRSTSFGKRDADGNRLTTIETIPAGIPIGQRSGLSVGDVAAVNELYPPARLMWTQQSPGINDTSEFNDHYGHAVASGDFNGDGLMDLAVGVPDERIGSAAEAGGVSVIYGRGGGLSGTGDQLWHQNVSGVNGVVEAGDRFGSSLVSGDFNGDGFGDLAIGVPDEDIGSVRNAGAVNVLYGSSGGLRSSGDQSISQNTSGIADISEAGDRFGYALAAGDFNNDGRDDLAIGVPYENVGSTSDAGAVNILFGSSTGLATSNDVFRHQSVFGINDRVEAGDRFGFALAAGDFNGDRHDDLVVGVPGESVGLLGLGAGLVNVLYGNPLGFPIGGFDQSWHQGLSSIAGEAEIDDQFGYALAAGDFNGDGRDDLAVGVPGEALGLTQNAGMVNVIIGSSSGLTSAGDQAWHQNVSGIGGVAEFGDRFGEAVAAGDLNGDGRDDLVVGVPKEAIGLTFEAGMVNIIFGSRRGLTSGGDLERHQNTIGLQNATPEVVAETYELFGQSLAVGDFDGDGRDDVAVGVPGEAIGFTLGAGAVNILNLP